MSLLHIVSSSRICLLSFVGPIGMALAACSSNPAPPASPPPLTEAPPIEEGWHATYRTTKVFDAPLEPLLAWLSSPEEPLLAAMEETDRIKKPVDLKVVKGTWPEVGAVRWLKFSDGHYTYERVLVSELPRRFQYQVFGLTGDAANHITYARGQQEWRALPDGRTELVWTYELRPNSIIKRPFVQGFLDNDMKPFMEGALDRLAVRAKAQFAGARADGQPSPPSTP